MTLIETLRSSRSISVRLSEPSKFAAAVASIKQAFPSVSTISLMSVDQAIEKFSHALQSWDWDDLTIGNVALVCRAYLEGRSVEAPLEAFIRRELEVSTSALLLGAAVEAYLTTWENAGLQTEWLAQIIQSRFSHLPQHNQQLFNALPELLDLKAAPQMIAGRMLNQGDPFQWLVTLGLPDPHAGNLMTEVYWHWLSLIPAIRTMPQVETVFSWITPPGRPAISDSNVSKAIEKLLEPWTSVMPAPEFRNQLAERITASFGDPRYDKAALWKLIACDLRSVLIKWLAGRSIDALLRVVTKATGNHMWQPRHDFWKGLYERGHIEEAWIVLSRSAATLAKQMLSLPDGLFDGAGLQISEKRKDTCLLIMRVGRYTVVEGSHDYRVHLFPSDDPRAPKLYLEEYDAEKIILPQGDNMARIHDSAGHWMKWVEERVLK